MMESHRTFSPQDYGANYYKEIFHLTTMGRTIQRKHFSASRVYVDNWAIAAEGHTEITQDPVSMFKEQ